VPRIADNSSAVLGGAWQRKRWHMKQPLLDGRTIPDGAAAAARRLQCYCLLLLVLGSAPCLAVDGNALSFGTPGLLTGQGWMVAPDLGAEAQPGLYHEVWSGDRHGAQADAERYTGIRHRFGSGLGLDTGIAQYDLGSAMSRYQEYYFGLSYEVWQGRIWYTNDYQGSGLPRSYYEFGITGNVGSDFSLSARLGYGENDYGFAHEPHPAYVFSARKRDLYGFGLNLQLMGSTDPRSTETEDLRFMGILSRPLP
jgi:hypothetical protein